MPRNRSQSGRLHQCDRPNWQPLEDLIGFALADWFMWMAEFELADGTAVHDYKHEATRHYLHLGEDGRAFAYTRGGQYLEIHPTEAIDDAFEGWEDLLPQPDDPAAIEEDLRRAREACSTAAASRE